MCIRDRGSLARLANGCFLIVDLVTPDDTEHISIPDRLTKQIFNLLHGWLCGKGQLLSLTVNYQSHSLSLTVLDSIGNMRPGGCRLTIDGLDHVSGLNPHLFGHRTSGNLADLCGVDRFGQTGKDEDAKEENYCKQQVKQWPC